MSVQDQLLTFLLNSKKGGDLPILSNLSNTDYAIVYDSTNQLIGRILKDNLNLAGNGTSTKIDVTITTDGQTVYYIPSTPDNIDLTIGRVRQQQNVDYTYANGLLTIINPSVGAAIKTNTLFDLRGYQNYFSKKEVLIITSVGQSTFILIEKPNNIDLVLNRTNLVENIDYTYNNTTGLITITNTSFINQITLNSYLEARKIF